MHRHCDALESQSEGQWHGNPTQWLCNALARRGVVKHRQSAALLSKALHAARSPLPQRHGSEQQGNGVAKRGQGNASRSSGIESSGVGMAKLWNALAWYRTAKAEYGKTRQVRAREKRSFGLQRICTASQGFSKAAVWRRTSSPLAPSLRELSGRQAAVTEGVAPFPVVSGSLPTNRKMTHHRRIGIAQAAWRWRSKAPLTAAAARQSSPKRTCASDWLRRAKLRQSHAKESHCNELRRMGLDLRRRGFAAESTGIALCGSVQHRSRPVSHCFGIVSRAVALAPRQAFPRLSPPRSSAVLLRIGLASFSNARVKRSLVEKRICIAFQRHSLVTQRKSSESRRRAGAKRS